jgi:hypothetical protein
MGVLHGAQIQNGYNLADDLEGLQFYTENTYGNLLYYKAKSQYSGLSLIGVKFIIFR